MADEKTCTKCGKKLRTGTPFATCTEHRTDEERREQWRISSAKSAGRSTPPETLALRPPARQPVAKAKGDAVARFKVVFDALGFDGQSMLEQYAQSMLDALHARADALPVPVALRAERRLPPEPVRLPAARAAGDRPTSETNPGDRA